MKISLVFFALIVIGGTFFSISAGAALKTDLSVCSAPAECQSNICLNGYCGLKPNGWGCGSSDVCASGICQYGYCVVQSNKNLIQAMKINGCTVDGLLYPGAAEDESEYYSMLARSRCGYLQRAAETWYGPIDFTVLQSKINKLDRQYIIGANFAEYIKTDPQYYFPDETRNFNFAAMCVPGTAGKWGANTCIPYFKSDEYQKYLRYVTHKLIDVGVQDFLFGQVYMQNAMGNTATASDISATQTVLNDMRQYAAAQGETIAIGAQTNSISDANYLGLFDYVAGGPGLKPDGTYETGACSAQFSDSSKNFCWALLGDISWSSKANNVLLAYDEITEYPLFVKLSKDQRASSLSYIYNFLKSKSMGFTMPLRDWPSGGSGNGCVGYNTWVYSADSYNPLASSTAFTCKDEDAINKALGNGIVCDAGRVVGSLVCKSDGSSWYALKSNAAACAQNSECQSNSCSYGICCSSSQCGWGDDGVGGPRMCIADGGAKSNQWLGGVCRSGFWKTALNDIGCSNPAWPCDQGTCQNNTCVAACISKTCASQGFACGSQSDGCGNTISCGSCVSGKTCSNGACVATCTSHASQKCDTGNLYWYNSCNTKEELAQNCGIDTVTSNYQCSANWLQKDTIKKGCANAACYATDTWINDTDCSASNKTCQNNSCVAGASNSNPVSLPTVNITANGNQNSIAADAGVPVTISWASTNADICRASGDWSGNLATSSTQTIASNNSKTYTVTCSNSSGSSSASVAVNIQPVQSINTTTGTKTNTNTNTNTTVQQPVVQMTRAQLLAAITQIQSAIAGLQKQLAALTGTTTTTFSCAQITKNLFYGMASDPQTKCLQEVLKSQGYAVIASGNYDAATKTAVALFQQKYAGEILAPFGLKYGSGNVGNSTRAKLNQIISVK